MVRFTDHGNGTITDSSTGLMWEKGEGYEDDWQTCKKRCESLDLAGYNDWRMPTLRELFTIAYHSRCNPACDPIFGARSYGHWSSTTHQDYAGVAWVVYFYFGGVGFDFKDTSYAVRAVRGGSVTGENQC